MSTLNRRDLLRNSLLAGAGLVAGLDEAAWGDHLKRLGDDPLKGGKLLGTVPFTGEARVPMGEALGVELDGRLYTDLTILGPENPALPTNQFYIRTRASSLLDTQKPWVVRVGGQIVKPLDMSMEHLSSMAKPMGGHVMECAGNARSVHFGMISVADWAGVPLAEVISISKVKATSSRVLISGFDTYSSASATSVPGASWAFGKEELQSSGAFLATQMNGKPLTQDHGWPVRLLVPGWYGCACIKWVNEIMFMDENVEATSQMQEYAGRTMQDGVPKLARDFRPAIIEQATMPIRIEKWAVEGKIRYRVVGILWGGTAAVKRLQIRFNPEENYVDVHELQQNGADSWSFWTHVWTPREPGTHLIRLRVAEPTIVTRRLDAGYYMRSVDIAEV